MAANGSKQQGKKKYFKVGMHYNISPKKHKHEQQNNPACNCKII